MQHIAEAQAADLGHPESWMMDSPFNDWAVRVRRLTGRAASELRGAADTYFFLFKGAAEAFLPGGRHGLPCGATLFVPAGVQAEIAGAPEAYVLEMVARRPQVVDGRAATITLTDEDRFEGDGFAYQTLADRAGGSTGMRLNLLRVAPGSGSPDFHIHAFDQVYFILEGEMHIDIGRRTFRAGAGSLVYIPAGTVHRNYNAGPEIERHISLLVPEPGDGMVFDYAVTIHEYEAEIMTALPRAVTGRSA
jgi:mannose-6-phosphate isomerase-like protein (cupin superfamily)